LSTLQGRNDKTAERMANGERESAVEKMTVVWIPYEVLKRLIASNPDYWLRTIRRPDDPLKDSSAKRLPCEVLNVNRPDDKEWDEWVCETLCDINPCYQRERRQKLFEKKLRARDLIDKYLG